MIVNNIIAVVILKLKTNLTYIMYYQNKLTHFSCGGNKTCPMSSKQNQAGWIMNSQKHVPENVQVKRYPSQFFMTFLNSVTQNIFVKVSFF